MPRTPFTVRDVFFFPWLVFVYVVVAVFLPLWILNMCLQMILHCTESHRLSRLYTRGELSWWAAVKSAWHFRWFFFGVYVSYNVRELIDGACAGYYRKCS